MIGVEASTSEGQDVTTQLVELGVWRARIDDKVDVKGCNVLINWNLAINIIDSHRP